MPNFQHDGIPFYYLDEGERMPFLFQHGLGGSVDQPAGLYKPNPRVRFISLDARGHGRTRLFGSPDKFGFGTFAQDLLALMNDLRIDQAVVGGISMGAGIALHFALQYPERVKGLVLSRAAWEDTPQPAENRDAYAMIAQLIQQWGAKSGQQKFRETDIYKRMAAQFPDAANSLIKQFEYPYVEESWHKFLSIPSDAPNYDRSEWERIQVPTLVLANRLDPIHPFEYGKLLAERIPGAVFKELTSKSVDPIKHVEETRFYIDEFLSTLLEEAE